MKERKIPVNIIIFSTLIKGFTKTRELNKALEIYNYMTDVEGLPSNSITFNSLIDCALICKNYQKADEIFQIMKSSQNHDYKPDLITYSTKNKNIEKSLALYNEMIQEDMELDEILFNSILDGCSKNNKYKEAMQVYEDMLTAQIKPSNVTYSILI